eukprot:7391947-Prymnesium_polylepis.2
MSATGADASFRVARAQHNRRRVAGAHHQPHTADRGPCGCTEECSHGPACTQTDREGHAPVAVASRLPPPQQRLAPRPAAQPRAAAPRGPFLAEALVGRAPPR